MHKIKKINLTHERHKFCHSFTNEKILNYQVSVGCNPDLPHPVGCPVTENMLRRGYHNCTRLFRVHCRYYCFPALSYFYLIKVENQNIIVTTTCITAGLFVYTVTVIAHNTDIVYILLMLVTDLFYRSL